MFSICQSPATTYWYIPQKLQTSDRLPIKDHPSDYTEWFKYSHRKMHNIRLSFEDDFVGWWQVLQPDEQGDCDGHNFDDIPLESWKPLFKWCSCNGFYLLMVGLVFWRTDIDSKLMVSLAEWNKVIGNVYMVFSYWVHTGMQLMASKCKATASSKRKDLPTLIKHATKKTCC